MDDSIKVIQLLFKGEPTYSSNMFLFVDLIYVEAMNRAIKIHALEPFLPIRVACDIYEGRKQKVEVPIGRVAICTLR